MTHQSNSTWILPKQLDKDFIDYLIEERGIENKEEFLSPNIDNIPSPNLLYNTEQATKDILETVEKEQKIVICGDFDSDGICATTILWEFLYKELASHLNKKIDVVPYIPDRIDQGYGLTDSSITDMLNLNANLIITVDCGVRDYKLITKYQEEKGVKFIITDHHQPPTDLPEELGYSLVHQMYPSKEYPDQQICGAAVAFLFVQRIKEEVGMDYKITENTKGLDLVALATVTDLMPLLGTNRLFVKYGLQQIANKTRVGMEELCFVSKLNPTEVSSYHLGYVLGPRVNSAGRVGDPLDGVRLFANTNRTKCRTLAQRLDSLNSYRQRTTETTKNIALSQIDNNNLDKAIFILGKDWHEGIVGLVAGKLLEQYNRPIMVATNNNGIIKGSARSVNGFNITNTLEKFSKYLKRFGGHELAAGFTAKAETIDEFINEFIEYANKQITDEQLVKQTKIDLLVDTDDITIDFINRLKLLEPYGYGNYKPIICLQNLVIVKKYILGANKNTLKLMVKGKGVELLTVMLFTCEEDIQLLNEKDMIDIIGSPDINSWNGNQTIQFIVKEWRFSS